MTRPSRRRHAAGSISASGKPYCLDEGKVKLRKTSVAGCGSIYVFEAARSGVRGGVVLASSDRAAVGEVNAFTINMGLLPGRW